MPEPVVELLRRHHGKGYFLPRAKIWLFTTTRPGELLCNCTRVVGRRRARAEHALRRATSPTPRSKAAGRCASTRASSATTSPAASELVRQRHRRAGRRAPDAARLAARPLLANAGCRRRRKSPTRIARSAWPIELHAGAKPRVEWLLDDYYEVPYGCFVPQRGEGLLVAGRCLSARARGGRLGARHRAVLLVRPRHRPRRRACASQRRHREPRRAAKWRRRAQPASAREPMKEAIHDTRASPVPQAPRPHAEAARALLRRGLSSSRKDHSATTGCESCAPPPTS